MERNASITDFGRVTKPRPFKIVRESVRRAVKESTRQIMYWAHMLDEAYDGESGINEQLQREIRRKEIRRQKAIDRMACNAASGMAEKKAQAISEIPNLLPIAGSGKYGKFIVFSDRVIVIARLKNAFVPFYCSTGLAGKSRTTAQAGHWFAFWGIGEDGWFNKIGLGGSMSSPLIDMRDQYGSAVLESFAKVLDEKVGDVAGVFDRFKKISQKKQVRHIVNQVFCYEPASHGDHSAQAIINYLNNMLKTFYDIGDKKAVMNLVNAGKSIGAWVRRSPGSKRFKFIIPFYL